MCAVQQEEPSEQKGIEGEEVFWVPKTQLGKLVANGVITNMHDALNSKLPFKEVKIVDALLPNIQDVVIDVNMVQRMTDSGRRVKFAVTTAVGNCDGFIGIGRAKGKEVGATIRKAIDNAKLNLIEIKRGCGSWECGCGKPHSLPFMTVGKSGSVRVYLKPAPRGIGLAVGDIAKSILKLAGVKDAWGFTEGRTKTKVNHALATFNALQTTSALKVMQKQVDALHITTGSVPVEEEGEGVEVEEETAEKEGEES